MSKRSSASAAKKLTKHGEAFYQSKSNPWVPLQREPNVATVGYLWSFELKGSQ